MMEIEQIPLSLYIHYPWCEKKCPYCDFNSHDVLKVQTNYIDALVKDIVIQSQGITRKISSIFIGGGTPSLMPLKDLETLLHTIRSHFTLTLDTEITIEVNPSSVSDDKWRKYAEFGINRVSIGVQSFNNTYLQFLGRVHSDKQAIYAIEGANKYFDNINLDIIFGLQHQSVKQVIQDVETALSFNPSHLSFYQLTIEPNTYFAKYPPTLPDDESLFIMMNKGIEIIEKAGLYRYEISAYGLPSVHNMNYWQFGDYIGLGAGAHGKLTTKDGMYRTAHTKSPQEYIMLPEVRTTSIKNKAFDFMLNALRLKAGCSVELFTSRSGLSIASIEHQLRAACENELLIKTKDYIKPTKLGFNHLNTLQELFL